MTRQPPQPPPDSPSGGGHGKAGYRPRLQRGEAVAGHHADRSGDARSGSSQAGRAWAAGGSHDYTHRGVAPLPARYYVLHGLPVPDDAPRTQPPPGFAALLAKRRNASPDTVGGHAEARRAARPGQPARMTLLRLRPRPPNPRPNPPPAAAQIPPGPAGPGQHTRTGPAARTRATGRAGGPAVGQVRVPHRRAGP